MASFAAARVFAGGKARTDREAAGRASAAIGPSITRTGEAEADAAQKYCASIEAQIKADRTAAPKLSERARAGLGAVAAATTDKARADTFRALSSEPESKREVEAFRKAVETRFGEEGTRAMKRRPRWLVSIPLGRTPW